MTAAFKTFTVSFCPDHEAYLVHETSTAFSFALVPTANEYEFHPLDFASVKDRATGMKLAQAKAMDQVRRLHAWQRRGNVIETRRIETPGRFEAVADTKYGCAW